MSETIGIVANLALTLSLIVAIVFGLAQVRAAERDRKERLTLESLNNFQTREFAELIHYVITTDLPKSREELYKRSEKEQIIFIQFGHEMESLGMLVAEELVDIDLVDKTPASFVSSAWQKYHHIFVDMRVKSPDPFLGEYFQWLAEKIDKRMRENPRRPYYENQYPLSNRISKTSLRQQNYPSFNNQLPTELI